MREYTKINEDTVAAVAAGSVIRLGDRAVVKGDNDMITLFFMDKVFSYPNNALAIKNINDEIGKYFYDKDAYVLDLPTRYEVYDGPKEYEDAKTGMAMHFMYELFEANSAIFKAIEWDDENGETKIEHFIYGEYINISYDLDEDKFTMIDDYGNTEEVYYNVEDEDWYLFQNLFREALADLVAETAKSAVNNNWLS